MAAGVCVVNDGSWRMRCTVEEDSDVCMVDAVCVLRIGPCEMHITTMHGMG